MSVEAVKRQILIAVDALNVPLNRIPSQKAVVEACSAAKLLRNRLLREHTRVIERIEALRERQMFDEASDEETDYERDDGNANVTETGISRTEFVFLCEMMVAEKLVIPLLKAHGMSFSDSLLPQLLKLLAVMLLPIPRYSADELLQKDLLQRIKTRCGTDEFFALLVQCVAPIAEKRTSGELQREDVVILEIILTMITYLLDGNQNDAERIIGAFCRNHGIELLLVVINQNYSRIQETSSVATVQTENKTAEANREADSEGIREPDTAPAPGETASPAIDEVKLVSEEDEVDLEDDDSTSESQLPDTLNLALEQEFQQRVHNLLESEEQLWKWNCLALASIASVIKSIPSEELAQLTLLELSKASTPDQLLNTLRNGHQLRDCKRNSEKWRFVARSRNGSVTSNGILVRASAGSSNGGRAIGSVSALLGSRRKDPLEVMKDMDLRKRGRFIKGMFQGATLQCNLPLPTKIQLSQQNNSFLSFGFEPLSAMTFSKLQEIAINVERATKEHREVVAGYKGSGETLEVSSPIDTVLYQKLRHVLNYMSICRCTLRYVRIIIEQLKSEQISFLSVFPLQWQSISSVISLTDLELGFSVLRSFLDCKDLRRREDVTNVVGYLSEILLVLNLLLQGDIAADPTVEVAAHALASSVLYKEENIKVVFGLLTEYSNRVIAVRKAQQFTLFTFSVFQLMEKCSYKGNLLLPKRPKKTKDEGSVPVGEATEMDGVEHQDDNESVDSATLEEMQEEMLQDMADMINDDDVDDYRKQRPVKKEEGEEENKRTDVASSAAPDIVCEESGNELPEPVFEPVEDAAAAEEYEVGGSERALSEGRPPSIASSSRTALSTISSEREVSVSGYFHRLATPKNISLIYSALRHWRVNDADVNLALTFLMDGLVHNSCETVFFNVAFLLLMREVLVHGEKTHGPLYVICDKIVYDFFNPSYAKMQDARAGATLPDEVANGMLSGAQSYLGFEVSLRCSRALFNFAATDYAYMEEKGMQHLMDHTVIPLPGETSDSGALRGTMETNAALFAAVPSAADSTFKPSSRRKPRKTTRAEVDSEEEAVNSAPDSEEVAEVENTATDTSPAGDDANRRKKRKDKARKSHRHHHREKKKRRHGSNEAAVAESTSDAMNCLGASLRSAEENEDETAAAVSLHGSMEETLVIGETQ
ncbi:hypothetical protein ABB37_06803 [Leptomonas pyrrhocoris]|uniref:Timeless N-terminal domain-containing protein n=1 Tax=Leptomonas pyrrhocoris TaxID=157538 RepID=A0A0N0DTX7_LEPPY|nr:hypothetical protein ABB37_06803 [Leptomonas pyrrhocoris]XP_015656511.1 hypothetical protein ABB37_06803 [Leptomonas pyrrhocoris]KPA78071.1 hypothetical protein ABB37_06803 [Leptomonas pyrrhocoris]KPA78072.1 hypothetical protein ABB37_06803 [Leptomonas pyrrhocoris]|eukprot:XP_015656510.1 hypothetical protein ABB37_06803 [Leptomonas pyrrhocoris]